MIHRSPLPDVEIPEVLLPGFVLRHAADLADKAAFIDGATGRTMTYGEFEDAVRRQAGGWLERGLAQGRGRRRDGAQLPEYARRLPRRRAGRRCASPRSTRRTPRARSTTSSSTRARRVLVTIPMFLETATAAIADSAVKEVYVIGEADGYASIAVAGRRAARRAGAGRSRRRRRAAVLVGHDRAWRRASCSRTATSSRTSSRHSPRSTMRRGRRLRRGAAVLPHLRHAGAHEHRACGPAPRSSRCRASISSSSWRCTQEHRLTRAFVAPPMVVALAKHPIVDNYDLSALRWILSGAAPLSAELAIECGERLGCEVVQGYGMTELSPVSHATPRGHVQARLGRRDRPEHRGQHRRSRSRSRRSASTRTARCGCAARR